MHRGRRALAAMTAGLTSAVLLATLAPASAFARRHQLFPKQCRISMQVAPHHITAGEPIVIFGRLRCFHGGQGGQTVRLFHRLPGQQAFTFVQSASTDSGGYYEFSRADGVVETNRDFLVRSDRARSRTQRVRVAAQVTLAGPPEGTQLFTGKGNAVTFAGTAKPADVGARLVLERQDAENGQGWHRIDTGVVGAGGAFSITHTFVVPGDASIRVLLSNSGQRNVRSASNVLAYEISQAENSALTIEASTDPIVVGQSVTIKGALAGAAPGTPLQLLARTRHGHFAAVAETSTTAGDAYAFAPQSPLHSTFYEVKGGGQSSAVLFEGVHDLLSAAASATSVQQGQPVTFSGSVSPQHAGNVIYLEANDAFDSGFHVIGIGFLGTGSTYTLSHRFYVVGSRVLRVFIPGGPENEGAASQTFTIQVTPAPEPALAPEPEGNSSEPPTGES